MAESLVEDMVVICQSLLRVIPRCTVLGDVYMDVLKLIHPSKVAILHLFYMPIPVHKSS